MMQPVSNVLPCMHRICTLLFALTSVLGAEITPIEVAEVKRDKPVDFEREILPVFKRNCLACHNTTDAKGELVLETPQSIAKGGETGLAVTPGKAAESLLLKLAAHQEKPVMPPRNNKAGAVALTGTELGLIKLWINQGATGVVSSALGPVNWQPLPAGFKGITSAALTRDGQYAAAARGNQIFIYHLPTKSLVTRLSDPSLLEAGLGRGIADRDVVQTLAFSPDGKILASGAYRSLKLWERGEDLTERVIKYAAAGELRALTAARDGELLLAAGEDGTIKGWNVQEGTVVHEYSGHAGAVVALSVSPDGQLLASADASKTIKIWKINQPEHVTSLTVSNAVTALAWVGTNLVAEAGGNKEVRIWQIEPAEQPKFATNAPIVLSGHADAVIFLGYMPARRELATGSKEGVVKFWNLENNSPVREINHGVGLAGLAVRADGKRLATAGVNSTVKLWETDTGKQLADLRGDRLAAQFAKEMENALTFAKCEVEIQKGALGEAEKAEKGETEALKKSTEHKDKSEKSFAEKSEAFKKAQEAKAEAEKALEIIKTSIAEAKQKKDQLTNEREAALAAEKVTAELATKAKGAFENADGEKNSAYQSVLDSAFAAKLAQLSALEAKVNSEKDANNQQLAEQRKAADQTASERNGAAIAAADKYASAKSRFDLAASVRAEADKNLAAAQAKAKGATEAAAANEKLIAEADATTKAGQEKINGATKTLADSEAAMKLAEGVKSGAIQAFQSNEAALKKAGEVLAKTKVDLKNAEAAQAQAQQVFETAKKTADDIRKPIHALTFSSDQKLVFWAGAEGIVRSASAETGEPGEIFTGHSGKVNSLSALAGNRFVSAGADQALRIWRSEPVWKLSRMLGDASEKSPLVDRVISIDFSEDGRLLASGGGFPSRSGELKVWRVDSGEMLFEIPDAHSDTVVALDFSSDGRLLASGGSDKFLRVFDLSTRKQVKAFEGHTHHVQGVSWKRDGRILASAGADKVIKLWDFASGEQRKTIEGFGKEMTSVQFLAPTRVNRNFDAIVSSADTQVKLVREDGNHVRAYGGASDFVTCAAATKDGGLVLAGSLDGVLRIWDGEKASLIVAFEPPKEEGGLATK